MKKGKKKLKVFRTYSSRLSRALSIIRAGRAKAVEEMFTYAEETDQELDISGNIGTILK